MTSRQTDDFVIETNILSQVIAISIQLEVLALLYGKQIISDAKEQ